MLLLISRYVTLLSSSMGVFNLLKNLLFNFYTPPPIMVAGSVASVIAVVMYTYLTFILYRMREPWRRWVAVYAFALISMSYFLIQLSLILISILRLTCCAGRSIVWHPTARQTKSKVDAPPPLSGKG